MQGNWHDMMQGWSLLSGRELLSVSFLLICVTRGNSVADLLVYLLNPTGMCVINLPTRTERFLTQQSCHRHLVLNCPLGKLYANSLLSSLNSRGGWKFMESQAPTNDRSGEYTEHGTRNRQVCHNSCRSYTLISHISNEGWGQLEHQSAPG